ncbi:glycosyl hydrolase family 8 [Ligilactobacillus acidipiscis]|uniref:glycosyl hydrolase family 8 n=1 Tax=Ligilactobacillus acidipiscis TaxID=89059 RepID=UPI0022E386D6|nr:glycosyl hydrolase family 8 [Ligilactobacillus acidipiscis]
MKHLKFIWIFLGLVSLIYVGTLTSVRFKNSNNVQYKIYEAWQQGYVVKQDKNQSFVNTSNNKAKPVALSEGQGYGLYITQKAGAKGWAKRKDFDSLLNYYLAHRDRIGKNNETQTALMKWRQSEKNGKWTSEDNSATDGDIFIAYSLHQAAKVWPKRAAYYKKLESNLTRDILKYEYNSQTQALTVGDWVTKKSHYDRLMRTSDVAPKFFEAFYQASGDKRWLSIKNTMLDRMTDLSRKQQAGLVPDFAWINTTNARPVKGKVVSSENDGDYYANACRVPMMLASSDDPRAQTVVSKIIKFFHGQGEIYAGYSLDGRPLKHYQSDSFKAPIFYANNVHKKKQDLREQKLFSKELTQKNYYDATLITMTALDTMNDKFAK